MKEILTPEGYWQNGVYYYYLKDHQGNNTEVLNQAKQVMEYSDYYPDGMRFEESTSNSAALPYRYNGKELESMNGLNQYDYGARRRETGIPVWTTVDPLCEKYYGVSPYAYCVNNPINNVDPNGEEIWIYYHDADNNLQKIQYTQGMKYTGDNAFVSASINVLNQMNSTKNGELVLGTLVGSKNKFDFTNTFAKDRHGNDMKNVLSFEKSKNGGGEIHAGALMTNIDEGEKLVSAAHESFHGYQYEMGQTMGGSMATVNNEVGAYLFGRAVYYSYKIIRGEGYANMPWGNGTELGKNYEDAMDALIGSRNFNLTQYQAAINSFLQGSAVNVSTTNIPGMGIYTTNHFKTDPTLTNPLIKTFFPLLP
ncbi:RHS repeat-associated core domain-containing protein [Microbacter margulisiae]|uniref:RHS repeat-associated protein n=2 Tax=Microbacter margulisiae TaxID=1350067 RepID=A0A7W5H2Y4_9PORP|nr:RHS repeat-associated core domain-containing protein [Microbacter margulisiae]MBB3187862.1 RHS repeat-associated protein [Microbacter margulisiae]